MVVFVYAYVYIYYFYISSFIVSEIKIVSYFSMHHILFYGYILYPKMTWLTFKR